MINATYAGVREGLEGELGEAEAREAEARRRIEGRISEFESGGAPPPERDVDFGNLLAMAITAMRAPRQGQSIYEQFQKTEAERHQDKMLKWQYDEQKRLAAFNMRLSLDRDGYVDAMQNRASLRDTLRHLKITSPFQAASLAINILTNQEQFVLGLAGAGVERADQFRAAGAAMVLQNAHHLPPGPERERAVNFALSHFAEGMSPELFEAFRAPILAGVQAQADEAQSTRLVNGFSAVLQIATTYGPDAAFEIAGSLLPAEYVNEDFKKALVTVYARSNLPTIAAAFQIAMYGAQLGQMGFPIDVKALIGEVLRKTGTAELHDGK